MEDGGPPLAVTFRRPYSQSYPPETASFYHGQRCRAKGDRSAPVVLLGTRAQKHGASQFKKSNPLDIF